MEIIIGMMDKNERHIVYNQNIAEIIKTLQIVYNENIGGETLR